MQADRRERDDLTRITGIGTARQLWLNASFDAYTFVDVAALYADAIEAQLKAEGKPYSRSEIELWLEEAATLAAEKARSRMRTATESPAPAAGDARAKESNPQDARRKENPGQPWKPVATFIVEFQTRRTKDQGVEQQTKISYHDTDKWQVWPGIEKERIGPWMIEHAGTKLQLEATAAPEPEPKHETKAEPVAEVAPSERFTVTITGLRIFQPAGAEVALAPGKNGRPHGGYVQADHPFDIEASFELGKQAAAIGERQIPYRTQFFTQNRTTSEKAHLGDAEPGVFSAARASYAASLAGIALPAGNFRLQVVVLTGEASAAPAFFELPMLRAL